MMNEESIKTWEQKHIKLLTSREMGEWLHRRDMNARPQGKWIITSEDTEGIHHIECPFCKYEKGSDFEPYIRVTFDKLPLFCEKCGADMRGKEE